MIWYTLDNPSTVGLVNWDTSIIILSAKLIFNPTYRKKKNLCDLQISRYGFSSSCSHTYTWDLPYWVFLYKKWFSNLQMIWFLRCYTGWCSSWSKPHAEHRENDKNSLSTLPGLMTCLWCLWCMWCFIFVFFSSTSSS